MPTPRPSPSPSARPVVRPQVAREHKLEKEDLPNGLRRITMHIGEQSFPVFLGYQKLSELIDELAKLDMDKVFPFCAGARAACSSAQRDAARASPGIFRRYSSATMT